MPYKPLMSTFEGKTHLQTGKQIQDEAPVVILQLSQCGHTLVLTEFLLLKTLQRFTPDAPPAAMLPPSALTPTPHAVRMDLASPQSCSVLSQHISKHTFYAKRHQDADVFPPDLISCAPGPLC